jgi:hypothetical protein
VTTVDRINIHSNHPPIANITNIAASILYERYRCTTQKKVNRCRSLPQKVTVGPLPTWSDLIAEKARERIATLSCCCITLWDWVMLTLLNRPNNRK